MLKMDKIQAELARLGAEVAERHKIDQDFFVRELLENHRVAHVGTPILSRNGDAIMRDGEALVKVDLSGSNKALELLARITGEMVERRDVLNRTRSLDEMTEDELKAEADKIEAEIAKLEAAEAKVVPLRAIDGNDDKSA